MTDKERIMINGVDVSKCKHYRKCILPDNIGCKIDDFLCCDKPNCYFKKLARKAQECESLNKRASSLEEIADDLQQRNHHLTQECEELKRKVELMMDCPDCKVDEYKKALEEIEKVCIEDTRIFADGTEVRYDSLDKILDIINKAKENK